MVQFNNTNSDTIASSVAEFHVSKVFKKILWRCLRRIQQTVWIGRLDLV